MRTRWLVPIVLASMASGARAEPDRSGFSVEIGAGLGTVAVAQDPSHARALADQASFDQAVIALFALGSPALAAGWFVTPRTAIQIRTTGYFARYTPSDGELDTRWILNQHLLVGVQRWAGESLMFGAGAGLGFAGRSNVESQMNRGAALSLRAAYVVNRGRRSALSVGAELMSTIYTDAGTIGALCTLQWQRF
jgi:hypothetical protein